MTSNRVGSVFLGDLHHRLHLSSPGLSSSPSSSPPSTTGGSHAGVFPTNSSPPPSLTTALETMEDVDRNSGSGDGARIKGQQQQDGRDGVPHAPGKVDPVLALELRLRWLEALVVGMKQQDSGRDRKGKAREDSYAGVSVEAAAAAAGLKHGETISHLTEAMQMEFNKVVDNSEGLRKFIDNCECAHLSQDSDTALNYYGQTTKTRTC